MQPKPDTRDKKPSLVKQVTEALRLVITSGEIGPGGKLPSEAALTAKHNVSRTVVREAIAALRSDGLVEPRQGAGVFVVQNIPTGGNPFQIVDPEKISSIIEVMELRIAVESEAAALAATRRSPAQDEAIFEAISAIDLVARSGERTSLADHSFHLAIARAANNPRFAEFLTLMGGDMIPRGRLENAGRENASPEYLAHIQSEHRRIAEAISRRDSDAAREAMRQHLENGQRRYRDMLRDK